MKKKLSILLAVILLLSATLACGADEGVSGGNASGSGSIIGTWVDTADGTTTLTFTSDTMQMNDNEPSAYTYDGSAVSVNLSDGSTASYQVSVSGNTLTLTEDTGSVYKFTRQ